MERFYTAAIIAPLPLGLLSAGSMWLAVLLDARNSSWVPFLVVAAFCLGAIALGGIVASGKLSSQPYAMRVLNSGSRKVQVGIVSMFSTGAIMTTLGIYLTAFGV